MKLQQKTFLLETLFLSALVLVLHLIANQLFLYWTTEWFDVMMHFLGGLVIGMATLFLFFSSGYIEYPREHPIVVFLTIIGVVLIIGLGWELWELFMGFSDTLKDRFDTVLDLIMDTIGGIAAYFYGRSKIWKKEN